MKTYKVKQNYLFLKKGSVINMKATYSEGYFDKFSFVREWVPHSLELNIDSRSIPEEAEKYRGCSTISINFKNKMSRTISDVFNGPDEKEKKEDLIKQFNQYFEEL